MCKRPSSTKVIKRTHFPGQPSETLQPHIGSTEGLSNSFFINQSVMDPVGILVKDGGFGTQITAHVGQAVDGHPLWTARYNHSNPDAVTNTHLDFLRNGADVILTNTYQASVDGYMEYLGMSAEQSVQLIGKTVQLAQDAKQRYLTECSGRHLHKGCPMVVASIGPYGAHLHDGSEYTGAYSDCVSAEDLTDWHRTRIDACLAAGVDALAIETIPCQLEAEALVRMLCKFYGGVKFWVSFQCKDDTHLAHGEKFDEAALSIWAILAQHNATANCLAVGVNCSHPKNITPLLAGLNGHRRDDDKIPLVVYPNSGEVYDVSSGWTGLEHCVPLMNYVPEWVRLGARIIGGCCRINARDIRRIKETVRNLNKFEQLALI